MKFTGLRGSTEARDDSIPQAGEFDDDEPQHVLDQIMASKSTKQIETTGSGSSRARGSGLIRIVPNPGAVEGCGGSIAWRTEQARSSLLRSIGTY